jgi:hypothetical protein
MEAGRFSTLTNGLLTVLGQQKKIPYPFPEHGNYMSLAFETSALYAFRSRTFVHIGITRVGNTQLCVHCNDHLAWYRSQERSRRK